MMHRGFIIYDDLWHGTLLLKESASKLTFYAFYRRCNLLSCYLLLPSGRYSTVIRGLIAIFRKCIISLYFGIEGGIPHFRQRCYPGTVLKARGYIFNRPAILKTLPGTVVTWDCRKVPLKKSPLRILRINVRGPYLCSAAQKWKQTLAHLRNHQTILPELIKY